MIKYSTAVLASLSPSRKGLLKGVICFVNSSICSMPATSLFPCTLIQPQTLDPHFAQLEAFLSITKTIPTTMTCTCLRSNLNLYTAMRRNTLFSTNMVYSAQLKTTRKTSKEENIGHETVTRIALHACITPPHITLIPNLH